MNLKYISTYSLPTEKAHGVQIANMCAAFEEAGARVELLLPESKKATQEKDIFRFYSIPRVFSVTRLPCRTYGVGGRLGYWTRLVSFLFTVGRYIKQHSVAMLYGREQALGFFFRGHFLELHTLPAQTTFIHRFLWRRTGGIIALTSFIKESLIEAGIPEGKIIVAHDAVPEKFLSANNLQSDMREKHGIPLHKSVICYVGKYKTPFAKGKGVDELIEAFPKIKEEIPTSFLLLVGINSDKIGSVKDKCKREGIDGNDILILSHVSHEQVIEFMQAADVLIMNYPRSEHHAYQISPMKLFEYMASGRPIVASALPSVCEVLNDSNAILIEPDNKKSLKDGVVRALSDKSHSRAIAKQAFLDVQKHTWQNRAQTILTFLTQNE